MSSTPKTSNGTTNSLFPHRKLHFKAHLVTGLFLLFLAFIGVVLIDWQSAYSHLYWNVLVIVYAVSSLILSWVSSRTGNEVSLNQLSREMLHWIGLIAAVYLVSLFEYMGFFSTPIASLVVLTLLALTTFLAGVHFDCMFLLIGVFLGIIAILSVMIIDYLSVIALPIFVLFLIALWFHLHHKHRN